VFSDHVETCLNDDWCAQIVRSFAAGTHPETSHFDYKKDKIVRQRHTNRQTRTKTQPHFTEMVLLLLETESLFIARSELRKVLFFVSSVCGFFLYAISREPLNGFAPNSHERRVWSLARRVWRSRSRSKVKGQGHQGQKLHFPALSAACGWFTFGKASFASSLCLLFGEVKFTATSPWVRRKRGNLPQIF